MDKIDELIYRAKKKDNTNDEWLELEKDMMEFMREKHPKKEKAVLAPLGFLEMVTMICQAIRIEKGEV